MGLTVTMTPTFFRILRNLTDKAEKYFDNLYAALKEADVPIVKNFYDLEYGHFEFWWEYRTPELERTIFLTIRYFNNEDLDKLHATDRLKANMLIARYRDSNWPKVPTDYSKEEREEYAEQGQTIPEEQIISRHMDISDMKDAVELFRWLQTGSVDKLNDISHLFP